MLSKIMCVQCSKEFIPTNKRNIYCSNGCKQEMYRQNNNIEIPSFLKNEEDRFQVFKIDKKEIIYREIITREYSDLRTKIGILHNSLVLVNSEKKAIESKINRLLTRNEFVVTKKIASISTLILGSIVGAALYFLLRFKVTKAILFGLGLPFLIIIVLFAIAFQKESDTKHEDQITQLPMFRLQLENAQNKAKSIELEINKAEVELSTIPQFARLTEEETKEIQERVKLPKYGLPTIKQNDAKDIMSLKELQDKQFKTLDFKGRWRDLIGTPGERFSLMLYGKSGHGKSTLAIELAEYLSNNFGNVTYNSAEEGLESLTLQDKLKSIKSRNLSLTDFKDYNSIRKHLKRSNCKFMVLDSVNHMSLSPEEVEELRAIDTTRGFITIHQVTKTGEFKGSNKFLHNCDIEIMVEDRKPIVKKNRYKIG